jgi:hypothetical protein
MGKMPLSLENHADRGTFQATGDMVTRAGFSIPPGRSGAGRS